MARILKVLAQRTEQRSLGAYGAVIAHYAEAFAIVAPEPLLAGYGLEAGALLTFALQAWNLVRQLLAHTNSGLNSPRGHMVRQCVLAF